MNQNTKKLLAKELNLTEDVKGSKETPTVIEKVEWPIDVLVQKYSSAHGGVTFSEITPNEILDVLDLTIKEDNENKLLTFWGMVSAYTETSQINISYNAPSSTGKSYIPTEIARLFPQEDVVEVGYVSPTAFFHDKSEKYDKEKNELVVNLARKILIFLDQPHTLLLQHLRPFLSHDKKELILKITDKSQKGGLRTKNIRLLGFPAVVFCTAGLAMDEQESTRFLNLSPEINDGKIEAGIRMRIKRETKNNEFKKWIESQPGRIKLKERIRAIKELRIHDVIIEDVSLIEELFLNKTRSLKPRDQRDVGRVMNLIKAAAIVNAFTRESIGKDIYANGEDVKWAIKIWEKVSEAQELNLPPYVFALFKKVIVPLYKKKGRGIARKELMNFHYEVYKRHLPERQLRVEILPMLDTAGLIVEEDDPKNKRRKLVIPTSVGHPTPSGTILSSSKQQNSDIPQNEELSTYAAKLFES